MVHILRLRDPDQWPVEKWDIASVYAKRRALMVEDPIHSSKITRLDLWLLDQPDLPVDVAGQIWVRMMLASSIIYEIEQDPEYKHQMLLVLREHFDEFRKLPEKWQERMRPYWLPWLDVLNREEREECCGTA